MIFLPRRFTVCSCKRSDEELAAGFEVNTPEEAAWLLRKDAHEEVVKNWRVAEEHCKRLAHHSPSVYMLLEYDDTTSVKMPYFGNRNYKGIAGRPTLDFVPWLVEDVGRRQRCYIYSFLQEPSFSKGNNRW